MIDKIILIIIIIIGPIARVFIELLAFYFLIKLFNKTINFLTILKPLLLYELGVFLFNLILGSLFVLSFGYYLFPFSVTFFPFFVLFALFYFGILFLFFKSIMNRFSLLFWKKSLVVFLIIIFVVNPFLFFFLGKINESKIELLLANSNTFQSIQSTVFFRVFSRGLSFQGTLIIFSKYFINCKIWPNCI